MVADIGFGALALTFIVALYGIGSALYGALKQRPRWVDSARNAMLLTWPLLTLSAVCIILLLVNEVYTIDYVASVTSSSMPTYLKITALWGGQAGSLIFWSWLMSAFASAVMLRKWDRDREFLPWVIVVCLVTLAFFLSLSIFVENPFNRIWFTPSGQPVEAMFAPANGSLYSPPDGNGLNPLLRHPGMIIHPPMLYLGFVSFVIPFAFAFAALVTGRSDDRWIRLTRRWSIVAWLFLSLGLILGGRWAYDVLGWGGYWGWDPVEIAAFMPWITGTAFLHSVMIQEKRGMLKRWNMVLIILTYDLVIFGTFLTRSGVLSSVHAFAQSAIGPLFFSFIALTFVTSMALLVKRWNDLRSEGEMTSVLSREALFLLNNLLFIALLFICFWGVIYPVLTEALGLLGQKIPALSGIFTGQKVTFGPDWYEPTTGPIFAGLMFLMGIAPLSAWRHSTAQTLGRAIWKPFLASVIIVGLLILAGQRNPIGLFGFWLCALVTSVTLYEFWRGMMARHRTWGESLPLALWRLAGRNRRRYGGYTVHLALVLMAIGILGMEVYQTETQGTIMQGEQLTLGRYILTYDSLAVFDAPDDRNVARAVLSVYKDGQYVGELHPRRDLYFNPSRPEEGAQPMTIPGVRFTLQDDLYVILADWQPITAGSATFKVYHNPLVNWLWMGALGLLLGALIAAFPDRDPETAHLRQESTIRDVQGNQTVR